MGNVPYVVHYRVRVNSTKVDGPGSWNQIHRNDWNKGAKTSGSLTLARWVSALRLAICVSVDNCRDPKVWKVSKDECKEHIDNRYLGNKRSQLGFGNLGDAVAGKWEWTDV